MASSEEDKTSRTRELDIISSGLLLYEQKNQIKGKVIFSLEELPIDEIFLSEKGTLLKRLSETEILIKETFGEGEIIFLSEKTDPKENEREILSLKADWEKKRIYCAIRLQTLIRCYLAKRDYGILKQQKKEEPKLIGNVFIQGKDVRYHTDILTVSYHYEGGREGDSEIRWEKTPNIHLPFEAIQGVLGKQYKPNIMDVGCHIRAICTPIRDDWEKGYPVTSVNTIQIIMDPKIFEEARNHFLKKKIQFEIGITDKEDHELDTYLLTLSKKYVEIKKKNYSFFEDETKEKWTDVNVSIDVKNSNMIKIKLGKKEVAGHVTSMYQRDIIYQTMVLFNKEQNDMANSKRSLSMHDDDLTDRDWELILTNARCYSYVDGDVILEEKTNNLNLYRIKNGYVKIFKDNTEIGRMGPDSVFGEMSFLGKYEVSASVVADGDVEVLEIEVKYIQKLFEVEHQLAKKFFKSIAIKLSNRLRNLNSSKNNEVNTSIIQHLPYGSKEIPSLNRSLSVDVLNKEVIFKESPCTYKKRAGNIYIMNTHVMYYSSFFGLKIKKVLLYREITVVKNSQSNQIEIITPGKSYTFFFKDKTEAAEVFGILESVWKKNLEVQQPRRRISPSSQDIATQLKQLERDTQEVEDWKEISTEAQKLIFQKGFTILKEGDDFQKIYQIVKGTCRIEKSGKVLGQMKEGEIFGEISFLEKSGASASIIAEDVVELYVIEGHYLRKLMEKKPGLGGRFFKYLASILEERLLLREKELHQNTEVSRNQ